MAENNKNQKRLNARKEFNRIAGHEENKRLPQHEPEKRIGAYVEPEKAAAMAARESKSSGMGAIGWAALAVLGVVVAAIVAMFFTDGRMLIKNDRSNHSIARVQKARAASLASAPAAPGSDAATGNVTYYDPDVYAAEVTPGQTVAAYSDGTTEAAVGVRHKVVVKPVIRRVVVVPAARAAATTAATLPLRPPQPLPPSTSLNSTMLRFPKTPPSTAWPAPPAIPAKMWKSTLTPTRAEAPSTTEA